MNYRAEIDGLRALAVLPVIFFHAGLELFSGGYVGVDIFFVISGYLITTIIITEIEKKTFSISNFYERRARRILPALFFVMFVTTLLSIYLLFPAYLKEYGQSLIYVSVFISNILFWQQSGYFDTDSELKPLLHTWSLAIEEQFYILFPIFLLIFWRFGLIKVMSIIILISLLSFFLAEYMSYSSPNAAFYMLPTRGWELLIGSLCALYLYKSHKIKPNILSNSLSFLGLILIVFSIFTLNDTTPFPGKYALIPTLGTALIIIFAVPNTLTNKILSFKIFVGFGLISYSTYLWHQPVISLSKHYLKTDLDSELLFPIFGFIFFIAYISWRFIEKPFRNKFNFSTQQIFQFSLAGILIFSLSGIFINKTNGLEDYKYNFQFNESQKKNYNILSKSINQKLSRRMQENECKIWLQDPKKIDNEIFQNCLKKHGPPLVILGDSHAMNLHNIFALSEKYIFIISFARGNCRAHDKNKPDCHYSSFRKLAENNKFKSSVVLYHQSGSYLLTDNKGNHEKTFKEGQHAFIDKNNINETISYLEKILPHTRETIWIGPFVEYRLNPKYMVSKILDTPKINFVNFSKADDEVLLTIEERESVLNYKKFSSLFSIPENPLKNNCFIWEDKDHFSSCGEALIARSLENEVFLND